MLKRICFIFAIRIELHRVNRFNWHTESKIEQQKSNALLWDCHFNRFEVAFLLWVKSNKNLIVYFVGNPKTAPETIKSNGPKIFRNSIALTRTKFIFSHRKLSLDQFSNGIYLYANSPITLLVLFIIKKNFGRFFVCISHKGTLSSFPRYCVIPRNSKSSNGVCVCIEKSGKFT